MSNRRTIMQLRYHWDVPKLAEQSVVPPGGPWGEALERIISITSGANPSIVAICGECGTGKTLLGVALMKLRTESLKSARYVKAMQFFGAIKEAYHQTSQHKPSEVIASYRKPSLLVIDEFGKRGETEWENNQIFNLIDDRYSDITKTTVLISNQTEEEFRKSVGASILSRMAQSGGMINCTWPSLRKRGVYLPLEPDLEQEAFNKEKDLERDVNDYNL